MKQWILWFLFGCTILGLAACSSNGKSHDSSSSATTCSIDGESYADGATHPENVCLICRPAENSGGWSMNDGATCDDGQFCNGADTCATGACTMHEGDPCAGETCDEEADQCGSADDDDDNNDDDNDDDNNDNNIDDDDNNDNDDNDTVPPSDTSPSFNLGVVHFHYYGDLGGYEGQIFLDDQAWVAANIELGIIGQTDEGALMAWEEILANEPRGRWLSWRVAHLFNTFETDGDCGAPAVGPQDQNFVENTAQFNAFLAEYPAYGDGEDCFLHARYDGLIQAYWHAAGCNVQLQQVGFEGSAANMMEARIHTLVWDEYTWLLNLETGCARDFMQWKVEHAVAEDGLSGAGFDNLGSPLEDGYYLPEAIDPIDVMEIDDAVEADPEALNEWWFGAVDGFIATVGAGVQALYPESRFLFNGASYCSWDGSVVRLTEQAAAGAGVWCENAIHYPTWGNQDTPDRLTALIDLSDSLAAIDSFLALETFYGAGSTDPSAPEILYYLSLFYVLKNEDDVLVIKPDWDPYSPLLEVAWFDVFGLDIGEPQGPATAEDDGVFQRDYHRTDGLVTRVIVRADGNEAAIAFSLDDVYCRVDAEAGLTELSGTITLASGDGLILLKKGTGGVTCE